MSGAPHSSPAVARLMQQALDYAEGYDEVARRLSAAASVEELDGAFHSAAHEIVADVHSLAQGIQHRVPVEATEMLAAGEVVEQAADLSLDPRQAALLRVYRWVDSLDGGRRADRFLSHLLNSSVVSQAPESRESPLPDKGEGDECGAAVP